MFFTRAFTVCINENVMDYYFQLVQLPREIEKYEGLIQRRGRRKGGRQEIVKRDMLPYIIVGMTAI